MKLLNKISIATLSIALLASTGFGQGTAITSTTLSSAINNKQTAFALQGATDVLAPLLPTSQGGIGSNPGGGALTLLYVGHEAMEVVSLSSTTVTVKRGAQGTRKWAHPSGATVYVGAASYFTTYERSGVCVSTTDAPVLPVIDVLTGRQYQCDAGTSTWKWFQPQTMFNLTVTGVTPKAAASATNAADVATIAGGVGGATTTATAGTGAIGGRILITGGVGGAGGTTTGTGGAGGALTYAGGAGGGTITGGTGGAVSVTSGAGGAGSTAGGTGGALTLGSGAAGSGGTGTSGAVSIKSGATEVFGATTAGAVAVTAVGSSSNITLAPGASGTTTTARTITSTLSTGTAPLVVTSTTPVANLTGQILAYNAAGTQQTSTHAVFGICILGTSCTLTLTGSAAFSSTSSYACSATDQTSAAATKIVNTAASTVTITGTGTDTLSYVCIGN